MKKRWMTAILAAAVLATSVVGCGKLNNNEVVAEMKDTKVTAGVANFYARYQQAMTETYYAQIMGEEMWAGTAGEGKTYEDTVKDSVMNAIEQLYVVDAHKEEYNVTLTEEDQAAIDQAVKTFIEANGADEREAVSGEEESVKKVLELLTVQNKMQKEMTAEVDTEVSDEEAAQKSMQYVYFSFNKTDEAGKAVQMTEKEKATLKKEAEEFQKGAVAAEDFEKYAEEQDEKVSVKTFDAETTAPSAELVKAADQLNEGEVSGVIEDTAGLYVAKVTSLLDREATDQKKETIVNQRKSEAFNKLVDEWKKDAGFKVNKKVWDKISFVKQGVVIKQAETESEE